MKVVFLGKMDTIEIITKKFRLCCVFVVCQKTEIEVSGDESEEFDSETEDLYCNEEMHDTDDTSDMESEHGDVEFSEPSEYQTEDSTETSDTETEDEEPEMKRYILSMYFNSF